MHLFRHQWEEINRQIGTIQRPGIALLLGRPISDMPQETVTVVTKRCKKCPKIKQQTLIGMVM